MSGRRFMVASASVCNGYASLGGELFNHIVRVLRLGVGSPVTLVDELGTEHHGVIDSVGRETLGVRTTMAVAAPDDSGAAPRLTICQGLPKGEKTEFILQKGTELGVHDFWLFEAARSVARVREEQRAAKLERWQRITTEAARQCGRRTIPRVSWFSSAAEAASASAHELRLLLWEGERTRSLKNALAATGVPASAIAVIGPEGGIDPREVECFGAHGFQPVTLGARILRTETAALAIAAILQYMWADT